MDLAGLEAGESKEAAGSSIIVEGRNINKQLSALSRVIEQLKDGE